MPWNNQGPDGNGSQGPWGHGPSSGSGGPGGRPPDLEELLRRGQNQLKRFLPGNSMTSGGVALAVLSLLVLWLLSGVYVVSPREQGVVLLFGKYIARTGPGIHYRLPWPIESVETPEVTNVKYITIGYVLAGEASDETQPSDLQEESLMLTGDENIVDINFTVGWVIKDAADYLFNVEDPDRSIKAVAESAMREVVGQSEIEPIMTQGRASVENQVRDLMQQTLDLYRAGVTVTQVKIQKGDIPPEVIDAYRDVQAARADQETSRNKAEAYANKIIPEARGNASKIVQDAQAYRQQVIAEAEGEAKRFLSVYDEYRKAPEVTRRRMYIETMSQVFAGTNKILLDENASRSVVPYLPLPGLKPKSPSVTVTEPAPGSSVQAEPQQ